MLSDKVSVNLKGKCLKRKSLAAHVIYGTLLSLAFAIPSSLPCVEFLTSMATNNQPPLLNQAADVIVYDQSDGLFSELVDASSVISQNQTSTQQQHQLRSVQYGYPDQFILDDIPVKFYNYSSSFVICRWINNKGLYSQSHTWTLAPNEELMQHTTTTSPIDSEWSIWLREMKKQQMKPQGSSENPPEN